MGKVNEVFAERIKKLRESKGMGVRELAAELGISHSAISLYESCKREPGVGVCKFTSRIVKAILVSNSG